MKVLGIRTDAKVATLNLFDKQDVLETYQWEAGRQLSRDILVKIDELLERKGMVKQDLEGIIVFLGPGSFTGLRIGVVVANTMADSLQIPNVGSEGDDWMRDGLIQFEKVSQPQILTPKYGRPANITTPKR